MAKYAVTFARSARRELESLPTQASDRILARIEALANVPRPPGCRKLSAARNLWRLRVGDYRVIYSVDDDHRAVDIVAVRDRKDAYR
jgi:mRNA interferase RelE/StbE